MSTTFQVPRGKIRTPSIGNPLRRFRGKMPLLIAGLVLLVAIPTMFVYISPGSVGIVIHKLGGGVDRTPLGPGLHFRNPLTTGIEEYPVYMQTLILTRGSTDGSEGNEEINVNSVEGQPVSLDVSLSFELDPSRTPVLYSTFRTDITAIQHGYMKQSIRQALQEVVGSEPIADMLGPKKAEVVTRTQALLTQRLAPYGFIVKQFTVNEIRAPGTVMEAINTKNVMQQQALTAQNELQKNMYQAQGDSIKAAGRAMAILAEARAQAEANRLLSQSITPTLVQYEMTKKWNGQMPQVSSNAVPMIQLPAPRQ
ncbi:MAG TPA: prohibitin family protein [Longimicrobiaceae bacterium]|nr:prohibitin family protein [Longimicrobiaceae bacterium]